ncbi:MAG: bifunctional phosphopantothenoylcysteine decarboxylase/phosphopantothenate--cysteine ligase CoaBC [Paludibacteraceae bacterium]|nr:bifunctional phosphopantothenoylcysteine decarboxylase/phosphopantothenate--cysteine ligase CoaBC [Paludibacteraceae bacterium]
MLKGRHIIVGISGGIAAYKIPELIRLLVKQGAEVRVTTTKNALQFVTETTLRTLSGHAVYSDVFAAVNEHSTEHISLPEWADLMLVAPATANVVGKMAYGIADDALTTTFAACVARKPVVIAPAMNDKMYSNPTTQEALHSLVSKGVYVLDCADGFLACGTNGKGRMQESESIIEACITALTPQTLEGKQVLITAGPTREKIDPVRFVSNYSSGKMGYAIAQECLRRGANVTLIAGPTSQHISSFLSFGEDNINSLTLITVESAAQMAQAAAEHWSKADIGVLSAAVADFTPVQVAREKLKKHPGQTEFVLPMTLTTDIAAALGSTKTERQLLVGFALETENALENAYSKFRNKNLDLIVLNSLRDEGAGFGVDTNKVTLITEKSKTNLPLLSKQEVAVSIIDSIESDFLS